MNRLVSALFIASSLFLVKSCSQPPKSEDTSAQTGHTNEHTKGHSDDHTASDNSSGHHHGNHNHGTAENSATTKATLTAPDEIKPNEPAALVIDIQDLDGKAVDNFEIFQEKIMHLIVVSDDLQFYDHIHPEYQENGSFEVEATFPQPGNYTLFSDYKPSGQNEQVSVLQAEVSGNSPTTPEVDLNRTKTFDDTEVELTLSQPTLKAGEEVTVIFNIKDKASNQAVKDLQPYLGELGHLVIVKNSSSLTRADYIHAHALKDTSDGQVHFVTSFPESGKYKAWGQFNRKGKIVTADFWLDVQ
ncbi:MAG: hypothetical protein F6J86_12820 [Symploca sp. SIO1B1]|nr:hypothetical protein [Symploca sp. SIO1B1]